MKEDGFVRDDGPEKVVVVVVVVVVEEDWEALKRGRPILVVW